MRRDEERSCMEIGRLLQVLVEQAQGLIFLSKEGEEEDAAYRISFLVKGRIFTTSRATLLLVLESATRCEPFKRCSRCRKHLPTSSFPPKKDSLDGLRRWCRVCERRRLSKWYPRSARKHGRSGPPPPA